MPEAAPGGPGRRAVAFVLDSALWFALFVLVVGVIEPEFGEVAAGLAFLAVANGWLNYYALCEWRWGATLGKQALGLQVVSSTGSGLSINSAVVRNLLRPVDALVGLPVMLASASRRRIGDRLARTVVVRSRDELEKNPPPTAGASPARRFFALLLDYLLVSFALFLMVGSLFSEGDDFETRDWIALALVVLGLVGYFILARVAWGNVTLGRRLLGMTNNSAPPPPPLPPPPPPDVEKVEPPEGPGPASWGPLAPLLFFAPLFLMAALGGGSDDEATLTVTEAIVSQLLLSAYFAGTALAVAAGSGGAKGALGRLGLRRTSLMNFGAPAAAAGIYISFAIGYSILLTLLGVTAEQDDITQEFGSCDEASGIVAAGLLIVVVAPIVEEVFFRGLLFGGLRRRLDFWPAAIVSGLIFGSIHFTGPDTLAIIPQLAVFGIALNWVYERTRSLWFAIFLHAINNAMAFAVLTSECAVIG